MKPWKRSATAILATLTLLASFAVAQQTSNTTANETGGTPAKHMHHGMWGHPFAGRMAQQLNLTDTQKQQIKTLLQSEKPTIQPLTASLASDRKAMWEATASGKFDETQVRSIANQQAQTMAQLMVERERIKSKIYNTVLTADQKTKADQMLAQFEARRAERQQKHQTQSQPQQ